MGDPLDDLRDTLIARARRGCFCEHTGRLCERHDAYDDGLIAVLDRLEHVGWVKTDPYGPGTCAMWWDADWEAHDGDAAYRLTPNLEGLTQ